MLCHAFVNHAGCWQCQDLPEIRVYAYPLLSQILEEELVLDPHFTEG